MGGFDSPLQCFGAITLYPLFTHPILIFGSALMDKKKDDRTVISSFLTFGIYSIRSLRLSLQEGNVNSKVFSNLSICNSVRNGRVAGVGNSRVFAG